MRREFAAKSASAFSGAEKNSFSSLCFMMCWLHSCDGSHSVRVSIYSE